MANYTGAANFQPNVYLFETTDPVIGGVDGVSNLPAKQLADRTEYLRSNNIGEVAAFAMATPPTGWLKANGARLLRSAYAELYALIGLRYGLNVTVPGSGGTVITSDTPHGFTLADEVNLAPFGGGSFTVLFGGVGTPIAPDTPCFIRVLSATTFSLHPSAGDAVNDLNAAQGVSPGAGMTVVELADSFSLPDLRGEFVRGWDDSRGVDSNRVLGSSQVAQVEAHTHTIDAHPSAGSNGGTFASTNNVDGGTLTTSSYGGTETRPRNVALLYCIKFG
jgi:microcystin-dependent protein